jgi:RNA polymerase sigma-70 factor, ECF subfamily
MQSGLVLPAAATNRCSGEVQATSDEALIERIAARDQGAMRVLFARHQVRVYRFLLRLVGDRATAEDLVSEVFLQIWRKAGGFEGRSQVSTWLLAIARYKALSLMRRQVHDQLDERTAAAIADPADDPETAMARSDRTALVRECLKQLSCAHREVIDLVYYHERTIEDVAEIVGVPANTVKTRMFHARKRLAQLLARAEGDEAKGLRHTRET